MNDMDLAMTMIFLYRFSESITIAIVKFLAATYMLQLASAALSFPS